MLVCVSTCSTELGAVLVMDTGLDEEDEDLMETDQVDGLQDDNPLVLALVMTGAAMLLTGQGSGLWYN